MLGGMRDRSGRGSRGGGRLRGGKGGEESRIAQVAGTWKYKKKLQHCVKFGNKNGTSR